MADEQNPFDQLKQDNDFMQATPADQIKYMRENYPDFASATAEEQAQFLHDLTKPAPAPTVPPPPMPGGPILGAPARAYDTAKQWLGGKIDAATQKTAEALPESALPVLSGVDKYVSQPLNKFAAFGTKAVKNLAETPIAGYTQLVEHPQGTYDTGIPAGPWGTIKIPKLIPSEQAFANAERLHPGIAGVTGALGEMTGGFVSDPRYWPLFFMGGPEVRPLLKYLIGAGFAGQMGTGAVEQATQLGANWDNMTPAQHYNEATKLGLTTALAGMAGGAEMKKPVEAGVRGAGHVAEHVADKLPYVAGYEAARKMGANYPMAAGAGYAFGRIASPWIEEHVKPITETMKNVGLTPEEIAYRETRTRLKTAENNAKVAAAEKAKFKASEDVGVPAPEEVTKAHDEAQKELAEAQFHHERAKEALEAKRSGQQVQNAAEQGAARVGVEPPITATPAKPWGFTHGESEPVAPEVGGESRRVPGQVAPEAVRPGAAEPLGRPIVPSRGQTLEMPGGVRPGQPLALPEAPREAVEPSRKLPGEVPPERVGVAPEPKGEELLGRPIVPSRGQTLEMPGGVRLGEPQALPAGPEGKSEPKTPLGEILPPEQRGNVKTLRVKGGQVVDVDPYDLQRQLEQSLTPEETQALSTGHETGRLEAQRQQAQDVLGKPALQEQPAPQPPQEQPKPEAGEGKSPFNIVGQEAPPAVVNPRPATLDELKKTAPLERTKIAGGEFSQPHRSYHEASQGTENPWVRRSADPANDTAPTNKGRTLIVQFSNELINKNALKDTASRYYDKLYSGARSGYARMHDFWETPQWHGFISQFVPNADVYVVRDMEQAKQFLNAAGYDHLALSALDVNEHLVKELADGYKGQMNVGGYVNPKTFEGIPNIKWHDNMESFAKELGVPYKKGVDYRHYEGSDVIPRISLSDGCLHKCAFCIVPKEIKMVADDVINQQADAIAKMGSGLVYVNDKTFGQAKNHTLLPDVYNRIKEKNPNFQGFIVQTTAAQMNKLDIDFLKKSGIKFIEIGVETYNDHILKDLHKPATETLIQKAADKIREAGIAMIPNMVIGFPGETAETYTKSLEWLKKNQDITSHANIYNLAAYRDSELGKKLTTASPDDFNENVLEKSWHDDPAAVRTYAGDLYGLGMKMLENITNPRFAPDMDRLIASEHNENGGSSVHPQQGNLIGQESYAFGAYPDTEKVLPKEKITAEDVKEFKSSPRVQQILKYDKEAFVGTWVHDGKTYFDLSHALPDREAALSAARQRGELAVFDLKNGKEIPIGEEKPAQRAEAPPDFKVLGTKVISHNKVPTHLQVAIQPGPGFIPVKYATNLGKKLFPGFDTFTRETSMVSHGMLGNTEVPRGASLFNIQFNNQDELFKAKEQLERMQKQLGEEQKPVVKEQPQMTGAPTAAEPGLVGSAYKEEGPKSAAVYHAAVQQDGVAPIPDAQLKQLAEHYGLNPDEYDFSKRDEHRHRVERDQLVKDLMEALPQDVIEERGRQLEQLETDIEGRDLSHKERGARAASLWPELRKETEKAAEEHMKVEGMPQATPETAKMTNKQLLEAGFTQDQIDSGLHLPKTGGGAAGAAAGTQVIPEKFSKYLREPERAGLKTSASQQKFVENMLASPKLQELVDISQVGANERKFYQRSKAAAETVAELAPKYFAKEGDVGKFTDLIASLSPRQELVENATEGARMWYEWNEAGRPEGRELVKLLKDTIGINKASKIPNAVKALTGQELWPDLSKNRYFKVPSFAANLRGFLDKVTNDGWIAAIFDFDPLKLSDPSSYHPISAMTRAAAETLGWEPAEAQAAMWAVVKTLTEKGETLPEEIAPLSKDLADIFATDETIRRQLTEMGVNLGELDKKLRAIEPKPGVPGTLSPTSENSLRKLAKRLKGQGREIPEPRSKTVGRTFDFDKADADVSFEPSLLEAEEATKEEPKQIVGSAEEAKQDTDYFRQAKEKLGADASISAVAQEAQRMKDAAKSAPTAKAEGGLIPIDYKEMRRAVGERSNRAENLFEKNKNFRLADENGKPTDVFFSVQPDGLITGVINRSHKPGMMPRIIEKAVEQGGKEGMVWQGNDKLLQQYKDAGFVEGMFDPYNEKDYGKPSQETRDYWKKKLGWKEGDPYPGVQHMVLKPEGESKAPLTDKIIAKYGTTDKELSPAQFVLPDGRRVPVADHDQAVAAALGKRKPEPNDRITYINDENAVRMRYRTGTQGREVVFSVPRNVTPEQVRQMESTVKALGPYGMLTIEQAEHGGNYAQRVNAKPEMVSGALDELKKPAYSSLMKQFRAPEEESVAEEPKEQSGWDKLKSLYDRGTIVVTPDGEVHSSPQYTLVDNTSHVRLMRQNGIDESMPEFLGKGGVRAFTTGPDDGAIEIHDGNPKAVDNALKVADLMNRDNIKFEITDPKTLATKLSVTGNYDKIRNAVHNWEAEKAPLGRIRGVKQPKSESPYGTIITKTH